MLLQYSNRYEMVCVCTGYIDNVVVLILLFYPMSVCNKKRTIFVICSWDVENSSFWISDKLTMYISTILTNIAVGKVIVAYFFCSRCVSGTLLKKYRMFLRAILCGGVVENNTTISLAFSTICPWLAFWHSMAVKVRYDFLLTALRMLIVVEWCIVSCAGFFSPRTNNWLVLSISIRRHDV